MSETTWHAGGDLLREYDAGRLDYAAAAAVESHLTGCAGCRAEATRLGDPETLVPVWERVATAIAAPRPGLAARLLLRVGVPEADVVVLRASSNLLVPFAVALLVTLVFAVVGGFLGTHQGRVFYLAIAPLLPVVLVGGAYDTTDALRELAEPTAFSKLRVALLRTGLAIVLAVPLALLMSLVPHIGLSMSAWLLPSLALTTSALALFTWFAPQTVVLALSALWVAVVAAGSTLGSTQDASRPAAQLVFLMILAGSATVFAHRLRALSSSGARG
jgi:hypothetical protein